MQNPIDKIRLTRVRRPALFIAISSSLVLLLFILMGRTDKNKDLSKSKQTRIELVAFHPQQIEKPKVEASAGPLAPPADPVTDSQGPKQSRMEPPKLQQYLVPGDISVVSKLVGNKVCAECHPGEHALHAGSGHARTLKPAGKTAVAQKLNGTTVRDTESPHILWQYLVAGERLEAEQIKDGKRTCIPLDYAVGSGEHGMSFVGVQYSTSLQEYTGIEHRFSYYTRSDHMDITPGQGERDRGSKKQEFGDTGRTMNKTNLTKCLDCHSTITSAKKAGDFDPFTIIPNVSCERCHGPAKDHVEAARRGDPLEKLAMPLGMESATPARQIHECGTCHRRIDLVSPSMIHQDNHELARFQPLGLQASACFNEGKSGLKCTTCHDPHGKVSNNRANYVNACVNCHQNPSQSKCKVEPKGDCIQCHMPKRTVSEVFEFTDHWIRSPKKSK